ncbi:MAG TPA: TolC family protein [Candidatus Binataceae bacterium]|nr:TolC family protein [Candidatus Binataceae bacterium]
MRNSSYGQTDRHIGKIAIDHKSLRLRARIAAAVFALSAAALLTGCASLERLPEVSPDLYAPRAIDRPWAPPADQRQEYVVPSDTMGPAALPGAGPQAANQFYELPELIDLALRHNPSTRQAWAAARAAAAAYGGSRAPYYPMVSYESSAGYTQFQFQDTGNEISIDQWEYLPELQLTYTLLDFGRRSAAAEAARQHLAAANFLFDRKLQDVVFNTQRAFYALSASKAAVEAARKNVELTTTDDEAVSQRMDLGLATEPALLLARQRRAQAGYDLENAKLLVRDSQADLAVALGMAANTSLDVENLDRQPIPRELSATVDQLIDVAVKQRPDLAAQVAALRQRDAELRRTKSAWYPTVGLSGTYGENIWSYNENSAPVVNTRLPQYTALVTMQWDLFTGLRRLNDMREAGAQREAARADLQSSEVDAIAQVWRAYFQFKSAVKKYEYALSILAASRDAYDSNLEAYRQGLSTIVELLSAGNDLANARYTLIQSKADLLTASAAVAYAAGAIRLPQGP